MTVFNWRHRKPKLDGRANTFLTWPPSDPQSYAYLLGIYLGDGHLSAHASRNLRLGIKLDQRLPDADRGGDPCDSGGRSGHQRLHLQSPRGCRALFEQSDLAPSVPQHGPGRKHLRTIELADWQREITHGHPKQLLRGLIHSDGCRCFNRFKTRLPSGRIAEYAYPRYFFSNLSGDIRSIFCEHCELIGIRWTQSNSRNISVAHRESVAILDSFIGPKT